MVRTHAPIKLGGSFLGDTRHVCAFFASPDDEYRTLLPFMRDGIASGERLVQVVPRQRQDNADRLRAGGVDVDRARESRQLETLVSEDTYLRNGHFDQEAMLEMIQKVLRAGRDLGFALTRLVAHAEHMTQDFDGANTFVEYESKLNYILPDYPDPVVCTYDLNRVSSGVAMDVMRTHPMVIIGGILQENPFFVPPDEFLREVGERRSRKHDAGSARSREPKSRGRESGGHRSVGRDSYGKDSDGRRA
jgi:MEDS: MEthanogen/methylotroph, DcmR Sensory domain